MKKRYFPHIVLCIHGRIFCLISVLTLSVFWYQVFFNFDEFGVVGTAVTAILSILTIFVFRFYGNKFGAKSAPVCGACLL